MILKKELHILNSKGRISIFEIDRWIKVKGVGY